MDDDAMPGVIPFTTFELERQSVLDGLSCKWISMGGGQGEAAYDFLCKGGTWATVSLMMDKAKLSSEGVGRVRLIFREWPETVHPGGGEAYVAQQFLQHVTAHFIPATMAKTIEEAFWGTRNRTFRMAGSLGVEYTYEKAGQYAVRRLEILGLGKGLKLPGAPAAQQVAPPAMPVVEDMPHRPAQPAVKGAPISVFEALPDFSARTASPTEALVPATPAELDTAPEPSSLMKPSAPAPISSTLVPDTFSRIDGREKAPTNFEIYNKAQELTRDVEAKATEATARESKISAPKPVAQPAPDPVGRSAPSLAPVGMPNAVESEADNFTPPTQGQSWPQGEGLGTPQPQVDPADPRFRPMRSLPQLKFIPKAVPLERADEIIQFEDEGSGL